MHPSDTVDLYDHKLSKCPILTWVKNTTIFFFLQEDVQLWLSHVAFCKKWVSKRLCENNVEWGTHWKAYL